MHKRKLPPVTPPPEPMKRHKALTSFSIESIMQSAGDSLHHHHQHHNNNDDDDDNQVGSVNSSAAMLDHHHHHHQHHHHQLHQRSPSISGSSLAASSPAPSSPIAVSEAAPSASSSRQSSPGIPDWPRATPSSIKKGPSSSSLASSTLAGTGAHHPPTTPASSSSNNNNMNNNSGAASLGSGSLAQVQCQLDNKDMWDKFHSLNTEMIITKTGRRMFPVMKVQFYNLQPNARYAVSMDIVPVDSKRYRYAYHKSCWQVAGKADPSAETRLYPHPDSPFSGDLLSRQVISFEKVKLTNNEMDKSGHIILNSMHKYQPRVHLIELKVPPQQQQATNNQQASKPSTSSSHHHNHHHHNHHHTHNHLNSNNHHTTHNHNNNNHHQQQQPPQLDIEGYRTFVFPETVFTAVTAYQNQLITKMKIDKNPFAKGFRDSSRLSDLDRNDPFDYMGSLGPSSRFSVGQPGAPGSLEAAAAAGAAHMDAYQLLASAAANNPWYSAAAVAAAAGGAANPFNPMGAAACSTAQAAQLQATQIWLAAFSACLNGANGSGVPPPGGPPGLPPGMPPIGPPNGENGPESSGGSSSSGSANSSGNSTTHHHQQQQSQ